MSGLGYFGTKPGRNLSAYSAAVLADHPSHRFRLNETAQPVRDSIGDYFSSTPYSTALTFNQPGIVNNNSDGASILYDRSLGNTFITVSSPTTSLLFDKTKPFTLEYWIKPKTIPGSGVQYGMFRLVSNGAAGTLCGTILNVGGYPNFIFGGYDSGFGLTIPWTFDTSRHLVQLVYDGSQTVAGWTAWVDGAQLTVSTFSNPFGDSTASTNIGNYAGGGFDGWIEEVALYPTALLSTRLLAHWNTGK